MEQADKQEAQSGDAPSRAGRPSLQLAGARAVLVCNAASGSNDERSQAQVRQGLEDAGLVLVRTGLFPDQDVPTAAELERENVSLVVTFGGDGTTHAVVTGLYGWDGAILVLPGGTMNLLSKRLHGDVPATDIIARVAHGDGRCVRTPVARSRHGEALTGILAGPGTVWNEVREAMRAIDVVEFVASTRQAISYSTNGPKVVCAEVDCGREEGYAAITVNPHDHDLVARGYYAESLADFAGQGIALLNRDFREGPHDALGHHRRIRLVCPAGEPMGLLIDGEPFDGEAEEVFHIARCEVDLVSTSVT
ncbi:diacylglycerol kinase [Novosphingobium sp. YJ-S2-02]|uniref:Diacylglycerol kinase n=1 Tax=Novosphingobium aureum TaxID=2792964 RepID=A0A931H994_9SPHN|nr:diacylglycerol kinase family protein [Novosphingobium aureum]MBH0111363.1 diacylglycerol kinase [Novosphingobium aureum]